MNDKIKILHLEDVEEDAHLVEKILKKEGIEAEIKVVDDRQAYIKALIEFAPDVILSDHSLPSFSSTEALEIFSQLGIKIPFILVTGAMSEEFAVSIIKAGAHDYILKDNIQSLPAAIIHAIQKIKSEIAQEAQHSQDIRKKTNAVLDAHESERNQLSYALLENINQLLAVSNLYLDTAIIRQEQTPVFMEDSKKYMLMAIDEIKKLSQLITPPSQVIGLVESLNSWIEFKRSGNDIDFVTEWKHINEAAISEKLQLSIYRIVQEQVNNIIKHSRASHAQIILDQTEDLIELIIKDDGMGFDSLKKRKGVGLLNINTRTEINDGKMLLESSPGEGCTLKLIFPL